jgi:hypothetical protein
MTPMQYLTKAGEFSTHLAISSFAIGTVLLFTYRFVPEFDSVILIGLGYVALAFVLNAIVFIYLFCYFIRHPGHREYFAVKMLIMLVNIPIAVFYFFLFINDFYNL